MEICLLSALILQLTGKKVSAEDRNDRVLCEYKHLSAELLQINNADY